MFARHTAVGCVPPHRRALAGTHVGADTPALWSGELWGHTIFCFVRRVLLKCVPAVVAMGHCMVYCCVPPVFEHVGRGKAVVGVSGGTVR